MSSEEDTQNRLRVAMSQRGGFLWRNNSGVHIIYRPDGRVDRVIRYGLANDSKRDNDKFKSCDLIGLTPRIIQPQDVGRLFGIFTAPEVKHPDWTLRPSDARGHAQLKYINAVIACGGFAGFVTHPDQLEGLIL